MKFSRGFTIIELVFVIVVLGILASIALPKLSDTVVQADIAKGRGDVATIRSAIANERASQVIKGTITYIPKLTPSTTSTTLFTGDGTRSLLSYGIKAGTGSGEWQITNTNTYTFTVGSTDTTFDYNASSGSFGCAANTGKCNDIVD